MSSGSMAPPFTVDQAAPALPASVDSGEDDGDLAVTVSAPSDSTNTAHVLGLTVSALG
jgi:hypothetical protein